MSRFITPTSALLTGLAVTTPALLATPAHADQTPSPASAAVTPANPAVNTDENSVPASSSNAVDPQLPSPAPSTTGNNLNGNQAVNPTTENTNDLTGSTGAVNNANDVNNPNGNQTLISPTPKVAPQATPVAPVTTTPTEIPKSASTGAFNLPVVNLIQTPAPTINDAVPHQTDAFLKAGSVSPSGGMDSNQIIKEAQDLGLNAVTVSLLTDFGDLHGDQPTISQADWDKMAANVTALQAKGYKVIIQLYPVINDLRDVETAWAPANKNRFFTHYDQLLERTARFAEEHHVYGMYLATNLIQTEQYEDDWETAIQKVRALYHGQLFFRTNWWYYADWAPDTVTNYNNLLNRKFWKDVDVISIAAYFELTDKPNPTSTDLQKALYDVPYNNRHQNIVAQIKALHDKWHKPIFFGELGIPPYAKAAASPWDNTPAAHTRSNDQVVANWFDAFYQVFSKYNWWKGYSIFTIDDDGSWYNPYGHPAATTIKNQSIEATAAYQAAQPQTQDVSATDPGAHTQVTRTIRVIDPHTQVAQTINQTVQFHRTATKNLRTGAVTYGAWQVTGNPQWAQYQVPVQPGYQPSVATVPAQTPTATTSPMAVTIIYQAQPQAVKVQLVDDTDHGKVLTTQTLTGVTDQNLLLPNLTPTNYDLVPNQPTHYRLTAQPDQTVLLHVTHRVLTRTETAQPHRVVQYQDPLTHQTTVIQTQVATLSRSITTDLVTSQVIQQRPWSTAHWDAVTAPVLTYDNHATNPNAAPAMTVSDPNTNLTVTFMYPTPTVTTTIRWVDDDAQQAVVKTQTVTGTVGQITPLDLKAPEHYRVVGDLPTSYVPTANQTLTVHVTHQHQSTTQSRWVERVISYQDPRDQQTHKLTTQKMLYDRHGDHDLVTDQTTWGPWPAVHFPTPDLPVIAGYTPDPIDPTTAGQITVTYHANPTGSGIGSAGSSTSVASSAGSESSSTSVGSSHTSSTGSVSTSVPGSSASSADSSTSVASSAASSTGSTSSVASTSVPGSRPSSTSSAGEVISSAVPSSSASSTSSASSSATSVASSSTSATGSTGEVISSAVPSSSSSTSSVPSTSVPASSASATSSAGSSTTVPASSSASEVISSAVTPSSASSAGSTSSASSTSVTSSADSAASSGSTGEVISSAVTDSGASSASSTASSPTTPGSSKVTASDQQTTSSASSTEVDSSAGAPTSSAIVPSDNTSTSGSASTEIDTASRTSANSTSTTSVASSGGTDELISSAVKINDGSSAIPKVVASSSPTGDTRGSANLNLTPANPVETVNHQATASTQPAADRLPQTGNHLAQTAVLLGVLGLNLAFGSLKKQRRN